MYHTQIYRYNDTYTSTSFYIIKCIKIEDELTSKYKENTYIIYIMSRVHSCFYLSRQIEVSVLLVDLMC